MNSIKETYPNCYEYIEKYGRKACPSTFEKPSEFETMEDFYKYLLENDINYRATVGHRKGIIL